MTNRKNLIIASCIGITGVLTTPILATQFIPNSVIKQSLEHLAAEKGIRITAEEISTAFPVGIKAQKLSLGDTQSTWMVFDRAKLSLNILSLFTGHLAVSFKGNIADGKFNADLSLWPRMQGIANAAKLSLETIPLLQSSNGGSIKGTAQIEMEVRTAPRSKATGQVKLVVNNLQSNGLKISGMPLPDVSCPQLRGIATIEDSQLKLNNLAFDGKGIYARLQGMITLAPPNQLNLNLDLMPKAELLEQQKSLFLIMLPYQITPGNYVIPIGGTLSAPQLSRK